MPRRQTVSIMQYRRRDDGRRLLRARRCRVSLPTLTVATDDKAKQTTKQKRDK